MNKTKMEHYYKPESKTLRLDEAYYTIIPNSDIRPLLDKIQQENKQLKDNWNKLKDCLKDVMNSCEGDDKDFVETILDIIQELEQGSDSNE